MFVFLTPQAIARPCLSISRLTDFLLSVVVFFGCKFGFVIIYCNSTVLIRLWNGSFAVDKLKFLLIAKSISSGITSKVKQCFQQTICFSKMLADL